MQHCLKILSAGLIAACAVLSASAEKVLYFDGSTYINTTKFTALTGNLSMSAWIRVSPNIFTVNPHNTSGTVFYGAGIVGQGYYGTETGFGLLANSGANTPSDTSNDGISWQVRVNVNASAANKNFASGTYYGEGGTLFTGDEWHHYLLVRDTATAKARFYVDGSLVQEADFLASVNLSPTQNFIIGKSGAFAGGCFVGYIADVALWNVALDDADAARLPTLGPQSVSTAPYAYFPLNEGSGTYVSNVVANVGYAKTAGTLTWQEDASFVRSRNFVVAGEPVACGIPSPGYGTHYDIGAGDSVDVSCPAAYTNYTTATIWHCTGWTLYDADGGVISSGAGNSFGYTHPNPAEYRRLVWQWQTDAGASAASDRAFVFVDKGTSSYWHTATNCVLALPVEFPEGASSATLAVSGRKYSASYANITTSPFMLTLPAATSTETENVYDLTLTFNDSGATTYAARLGLIKGYDTTTMGSTRCLAPITQYNWNRVKGRRAVFPIPYGMTDFTVGGIAMDTGLGGDQGWYALDVPGGQTIPLTLDELTAALFGASLGTILIVK